MDVLVMDATHGGVKLAIDFSKTNKYENIYIYDIYNTLKDDEIEKLEIKNVQIKNLENINSDDILVIYPIHLPLTIEELKERINSKKITFITHHKAVKLLLDDFFKTHKNILKIEITGVKGKTSSAFMLKEILKDLHPLLLTSLGIIQTRDYHDIILSKNISITPANIKQTVDLAYRIDNPACNLGCRKSEPTDNVNYKCIILESSLGVSGIGDIGLLTNIVENYPIAKNKSDAKTAKSQIFNCKKVVIKKETLNKFYKKEADKFKSKINTFSIEYTDSNVIATDINYNYSETTFKIIYKNIKTINDKLISGEFNAKSFAIGPHHIENILGVIATCLTSEISEKIIKEGLANYNGIEGRSHIKTINDLTIIEEINPGINTKSIEFSISMLKNPEKYSIIIGGDYGITCEEINEQKVAELLDNKANLNIILTGDVGKNIKEKMTNPVKYIESYTEAINESLSNKLNILFIYRSDYRELSQR